MSPQQVQLPIELQPKEIKSEKCPPGEIFGVQLEEVMRHPMNQDQVIPLIVLNAMRYLFQNATKVEGIFRLSGRAQRLDEIKRAYNRGEAVDFSAEPDVHVIAGLLKSYFRELPDPLCCFDMYHEWISSYDVKDIQSTKTKMKTLLSRLPTTNYRTLSSLMALLSQIAQCSQETKMTPPNLAICWAPNILKPREESLTSALTDSGTVNGIVSMFITYYGYFFPMNGLEEENLK